MYAQDYRRMARESLNEKWPISVLVCFIAALLGASSFSEIITYNINDGGVLQLKFGSYVVWQKEIALFSLLIFAAISSFIGIFKLIQFIIGGTIELGLCKYFMKSVRKQDAQLNDLFSYFSFFGKALGLRIVTTIFIVLWSLLLIVPGIIAYYRYSMATYIMAENPNISIMDAINESKIMMDGRKGALFCLDFSFIGWSLLSALTLGIGYLFLSPYMDMAHAHFYLMNRYGQKQNIE